MKLLLSDINAACIAQVFGQGDGNISVVEEAFCVQISLSNGEIQIISTLGNEQATNNTELAASVIRRMIELSTQGEVINRQMTAYLCDLASEGGALQVQSYQAGIVCVTARGKSIKAKTNGQMAYIESIRKKLITFGIGPAGTGKTYLAVAMAVEAFRRNEVSRIILTRPAVEAGEKLGFLPGDLQSKVDPYLRPLQDALYDIMGIDSYNRNVERGAIEIAPLAYMRGRTLDHSFIILDEAQNTTQEQLKMFLTRIGQGSKAVVTGDVTQIDLPKDKTSGLKKIHGILGQLEEIGFCNLTGRDVVRCELVQKIIRAYEKFE